MELSWLMCNKCFLHIAGSTVPFSLTQCGHLFCGKCIQKVGTVCPVCKATGIQTAKLTAPLQPIFVPMFTEPMEVVEKILIGLKFQKFQMKIVEHHEKELAKKYVTLKTAYVQMGKEMKKIAHAYNQLKETYDRLVAIQKAQDDSNIFNGVPKNRRVNFIKESAVFGQQQSYRHAYRPKAPNYPSNSGGSEFLMEHPSTPVTLNSMFRVPTMTRVPQSVGTTLDSSRVPTPIFNHRGQNGRYGDAQKSFYARQ